MPFEAPVLVRLGDSIATALSNNDVLTEDFVEVCDVLIPVFDKLGTVFMFAKKEFSTKNASLEKASGRFGTLRELVDHDRQSGQVCVKGSCARNLHRLGSALTFIAKLMTELTHSDSVSLREAADAAYQFALAPIHTKIVKVAVTSGLYMLPSRDAFIRSIDESESTARDRAESLSPLVEKLVCFVESLYDEPMPVSNTWFLSY